MAQLNNILGTELLHGLFTKETKDDTIHKVYEFVYIANARASENVLLDIYAASALKVMLLLDEGFDDITAVLRLPLWYRKSLEQPWYRKTQPRDKKMERVIRIFPNEISAIRLIGALLIEQDEKWSTVNRSQILRNRRILSFLSQKEETHTRFA